MKNSDGTTARVARQFKDKEINSPKPSKGDK
jgi:hypothetical protein